MVGKAEIGPDKFFLQNKLYVVVCYGISHDNDVDLIGQRIRIQNVLVGNTQGYDTAGKLLFA